VSADLSSKALAKEEALAKTKAVPPVKTRKFDLRAD
jgi:hypothetical protein